MFFFLKRKSTVERDLKCRTIMHTSQAPPFSISEDLAKNLNLPARNFPFPLCKTGPCWWKTWWERYAADMKYSRFLHMWPWIPHPPCETFLPFARPIYLSQRPPEDLASTLLRKARPPYVSTEARLPNYSVFLSLFPYLLLRPFLRIFLSFVFFECEREEDV